MNKPTKKQWINCCIVVILWLAFIIWIKSWLGLLIVPFIVDAYITKIIPYIKRTFYYYNEY